MKIAKNRAKNELKEIQLIEKSQRDGTYASEIRISNKFYENRPDVKELIKNQNIKVISWKAIRDLHWNSLK
ncbi:hypothetical protein [Paenibacillus sp. GCM10012306]|uniref:hypothetical protein n=1 Tax=Paenibacillus sp. GCM10012306 TaxID=3317342 RepID=UPI0036D22FE5